MVGHDAVVVCDTVVGRDAVVGRAVVGCAAVVGHDVENLYLNSCFCREKVEKPSPACQESLPKTGKIGEMGRETKLRLPEISTQIAEIPGKGRETKHRLPEIST